MEAVGKWASRKQNLVRAGRLGNRLQKQLFRLDLNLLDSVLARGKLKMEFMHQDGRLNTIFI